MIKNINFAILILNIIFFISFSSQILLSHLLITPADKIGVDSISYVNQVSNDYRYENVDCMKF